MPFRTQNSQSFNSQTGRRPRVLHFSDCAFVGANIVRAATQNGYFWDYLPPQKIRPSRMSASLPDRLTWLPYVARHWAAAFTHDVIHVHSTPPVALLSRWGIPCRPYLLHLHGTEIRKSWKDPRFHDQIQRAVDNAVEVFYTNADTVEQATAARSDARYMPAFVNFSALPDWDPPRCQNPRIVFTSRWDEDKGVTRQLELAAALHRAFPEVVLEGLNWGPEAELARNAGVKLCNRMKHSEYLRWLSTASVAVGQANKILAVSEFEAMAIGLPVAALGSRLPRPDDASTPPVIEGEVNQVVEGIRESLRDPKAMAQSLGGVSWVREHHDPQKYIESLASFYRKAYHG